MVLMIFEIWQKDNTSVWIWQLKSVWIINCLSWIWNRINRLIYKFIREIWFLKSYTWTELRLVEKLIHIEDEILYVKSVLEWKRLSMLRYMMHVSLAHSCSAVQCSVDKSWLNCTHQLQNEIRARFTGLQPMITDELTQMQADHHTLASATATNETLIVFFFLWNVVEVSLIITRRPFTCDVYMFVNKIIYA